MGRTYLRVAFSSIVKENIMSLWHGYVTWTAPKTFMHPTPYSSKMVTIIVKEKILYCFHVSYYANKLRT